ncbi:MAG: MoaD/ThiS family protein [bacterium]|jgi:sulfur-carrier protein|nr:MoaD/ThiS family protein [bacterium]
MIRVILPFHLMRLSGIQGEVVIAVGEPVTQRSLIDAIEQLYPMLRGTIRDHRTQERRPYLRYFACGEDLSHQGPDAKVPNPVVQGLEPFRIVGAMSGG